MPRLKITYDKEIIANLMSKLSLKNKHDVPKIEKIILKTSDKLEPLLWENHFKNQQQNQTDFTE